jgi:hypothetical protein
MLYVASTPHSLYVELFPLGEISYSPADNHLHLVVQCLRLRIIITTTIIIACLLPQLRLLLFLLALMKKEMQPEVSNMVRQQSRTVLCWKKLVTAVLTFLHLDRQVIPTPQMSKLGTLLH